MTNEREFDLRGFLASKLICWHRLTVPEVDNLLEVFDPATAQLQPRTLDAPVSEPNLLSISEQRAVLADLMGLECLINRHDCWETEADARDMAECVPGHSKRRKELIEMGRAIIAADPDCWYDEQKAPFKLRYGESAAPTPRKGEHHE